MPRYIFITLFSLAISAVTVHAEEGHDVFWSIEREGQQLGYLLGTVHSEDPRVLGFTETFLSQLSGSQTFAMELVPDQPTLMALVAYMNLPENTSLEQEIGAQRFASVANALNSYGVPESQVARMKPWAAMMTLSVPPPSTGIFMDFSLSLRAAGNGLTVVGLETLEEQLAFLENMSKDQQLALLDHAVEEFDRVDEVHEQLVDVYLDGGLDKLQTLASEQMQMLSPDAYAYFKGQGIDARNHRMAENLLPLLKLGGVFAAVGALHLPGDEGLLALLEKEGYHLEAMPSPFEVKHP